MSQKSSYIDRMENFLEEHLNKLTPLEAVLYLNLFHLQNKARLQNGSNWPEWFEVKNLTLAGIMDKEQQNIRLLRNALKTKGLIDFIPGRKGHPTQYKLMQGKGVKIGVVKLPPIQEKGVKSPPENYPLNYPLNVQKRYTPQGLATSLREEENKRKKKNKKKAVAFSPPSVEAVRAYCQEKGLPIDPVHFVEYFTEGDWHDSNGRPVKNWKQKLLTWARHNKLTGPAPSTASSPILSVEEQEARRRAEAEQELAYMERMEANE